MQRSREERRRVTGRALVVARVRHARRRADRIPVAGTGGSHRVAIAAGQQAIALFAQLREVRPMVERFG